MKRLDIKTPSNPMIVKAVKEVVDVKADASTFSREDIRTIQTKEGNSPCYQSEISQSCGIEDCLWRKQGCVS